MKNTIQNILINITLTLAIIVIFAVVGLIGVYCAVAVGVFTLTALVVDYQLTISLIAASGIAFSLTILTLVIMKISKKVRKSHLLFSTVAR
jgi:hypothetical protein